MDEIVVYIEKIEANKEGSYDVILDFPVQTETRNDFRAFLNVINMEQSLTGPSMLELLNVKFNNIRPRSGLYYSIPKELINAELWTEKINRRDENQVILFLVDFSDKQPLTFGKARPYSKYIYNLNTREPDNWTEATRNFDNLCKDSNGLKFFVWNVGQGNMNQIWFAPCSFVLFDLGSRRRDKISPRIEEFLDKYRKEYKLRKELKEENKSVRILMISHWDVDHYKGIFELIPKHVDVFSLILIPNQLPCNTSKLAYDIMKNGKIRAISMRHRFPKRNATELELFYQNNIFKFYKGSKHYNRNMSGLSLTAHYKNSDIILTGDLHNEQVNDYLVSGCKGHEQYIVVPHHGGYSGSKAPIRKMLNLKNAIVSVGEPEVSYQHPLPKIMEEYEKIVGKNGIHKTVRDFDFCKTIP